MADRRRRKVRRVSARERAKRLGWRVDPPDNRDDDPGDGDPTGARRRRRPRDATADGEVRP
jgi:hypothetical protein